MGAYPVAIVLVLFAALLAMWTRRLEPMRVIDIQTGSRDRNLCVSLPEYPMVALSPDGGYSFGGRRVTITQLRSALDSVYYVRPDKAVVIDAAPMRSYAEFIKVADVARGAGVQVVGISDGQGRQRWCFYMTM